MRVLLINPPYLTLASTLGVGHQVPLGLLMVGGSLIDAGHEVKLLDAERRHLSIRRIVSEVRKIQPDGPTRKTSRRFETSWPNALPNDGMRKDDR